MNVKYVWFICTKYRYPLPVLRFSHSPPTRLHLQSGALKSRTMSTSTFLDVIAKRRTYYALGAESPISDARIQEIIRDVLLRVPSAFNSQSTRVVLLAHEEHRKLWSMTKEVLKGVVPAEQFPTTEKKLDSFKAAYGTVSPLVSFTLFHDDLVPHHSSWHRFFSLMIGPQSSNTNKSSHSMPTRSQTGPSSPTVCTSLHFGQRWKRKASEQIYSTITL